jgi:hypothetical protein
MYAVGKTVSVVILTLFDAAAESTRHIAGLGLFGVGG